MNTIILEGREYILRCDLNVVEKIEGRYGSIDAMYEETGKIPCVRFLVAEMVNEHFYFVKSPERITETMAGALMTSGDMVAVMRAVLAEISDCVTPKNV